MNQKTEGLFSNTNYKLLLQLLRVNTSKPKPFLTFIHPREWIPPPCLTSAPQKGLKKDLFHKFLNIDTSSDEMDQVDQLRSKYQNQKKEISPHREQDKVSHKLKHLKRDQELLKEAQFKIRSGEGLSSLNDLIHKWRVLDQKTSKNLGLDRAEAVEASQSDSHQQSKRMNFLDFQSSDINGKDGARRPSTKTDSEDTSRTEKALQDLERSFRQAKEEEERLRRKLKRLKKEDKSKENKRPTIKLKKLSNQTEYKMLAMKRRYEDLLQYLARLESKNNELKKENEVLHTTLKEENEFPARDKILVFEQELLNRNNELKILTTQLRAQDSIQEENVKLKNKIEELNRLVVNRERERDLKEEEFEREWAKKATDMKMLYEKAVQGYKEQLLRSRTSYEALEQRLRTLIQYYEKNEKSLIERFENEIKSLKEEAKSSRSEVRSPKISGDKEQETISLLQLETLLEKKDNEIALLKEALVKPTAVQKEDTSEHFQKEVLEKLSDIMEKATVDENCLESIKDVIKKVFEDFTETHKAEVDKEENLSMESDQLRKEVMEKNNEIFVLKRDLVHLEKNLEKLTSECEQNIGRINIDEKSVLDVELLKEFPRILKENETKLKTSQSTCQQYQIEVKLCQERLRSSAADLETKKERISELDDKIKDLTGVIKKLEREKDKLESKIETLDTQIEKKNRILEKNSSQIEERIRESRSLASQLERLREEHSKEIAILKESNYVRQSDSKLQEAQTLNVRLESQLSALKSEKILEEKMTKKQLRFLEDQVSQLKIRNITLQKNLQTIQDTYKSIFGLEGHLFPFLTIPTTSSFPNRELHLETNGTNPK